MSQKSDRTIHLVLLGIAVFLIVLFLILGSMEPIPETDGVLGEVGRIQHDIQEVEHKIHDALFEHHPADTPKPPEADPVVEPAGDAP